MARRNVFDLLRAMPAWGVGAARVAKAAWAPRRFYLVTKLRLNDERHGVAYGVFHADGKPTTGVAERIGKCNRRGWREVEDEAAPAVPQEAVDSKA
eukprot:SM000006S19321  [mRNA]  locus=s6:72746:73161:+ [translate_table: standard]